jgi:hypothetical protein
MPAILRLNRPIRGSDSQGNSDFREITRNLSLTFAAFGDTGQFVSDLDRPFRHPVVMISLSATPMHH